jgi:cytochrome P450 family 4
VFTDNTNSFFSLTHRLADIIHRRSYDFILRYDIFFKFTHTYQRQKTLIKLLHEFTDKVIVARREKLLDGNATVENDDEGFGGKKKMALLDILLQSTIDGKFLTNEDIREEIDTFMFEVNANAANVFINFKFYFSLSGTRHNK